MACEYFSMQVNPWKTIVLHSGNMSCPPEVVPQWHGFNAEHLGLLQNFNVCDEITPANVDDGAETSLVKARGEKYVTAVGDPSQ